MLEDFQLMCKSLLVFNVLLLVVYISSAFRLQHPTRTAYAYSKAHMELAVQECARMPVEIEAGRWSHFLSLTFPDLRPHTDKLPTLRIGIDAFELRVDLLDDQSPENIVEQIDLLRAHCRLPIVYTVRTRGQIGKYPDDGIERIEKLLQVGLEAGVEWLDVEACLPHSTINRICSLTAQTYPNTRLLGSLHTTQTVNAEEIQAMFDKCDLSGTAHLLKVVTGAINDADCELIHQIGQQQRKPYIGLCLGAAGQLSRVLNKRFTPVTHASLTAAAPGQLSVEQLMQRRSDIGLIHPKQFYLFGMPIQQSLSPSMHNAAFKALHLPHHYSLREEADVSSYDTLLLSQIEQREGFGGASVTIPHKESIMSRLQKIDSAAMTIGAVNTIVPADSILTGYNTDWLGMLRPLQRLLARKSITTVSNSRQQGWGLVVGAGGTARAACYTIEQLGLKLVVVNRSKDKAVELAQRYCALSSMFVSS